MEIIFITSVICIIVAIFLVNINKGEPEFYHIELDEPDSGCIVQVSVNGVEFEGYLSEDKNTWNLIEGKEIVQVSVKSNPFWKYK